MIKAKLKHEDGYHEVLVYDKSRNIVVVDIHGYEVPQELSFSSIDHFCFDGHEIRFVTKMTEIPIDGI